MSRLVLPCRPIVGDQVEINGGPTHTIVACETAGVLRFEDGSTASWRLEAEAVR